MRKVKLNEFASAEEFGNSIGANELVIMFSEQYGAAMEQLGDKTLIDASYARDPVGAEASFKMSAEMGISAIIFEKE